MIRACTSCRLAHGRALHGLVQLREDAPHAQDDARARGRRDGSPVVHGRSRRADRRVGRGAAASEARAEAEGGMSNPLPSPLRALVLFGLAWLFYGQRIYRAARRRGHSASKAGAMSIIASLIGL